MAQGVGSRVATRAAGGRRPRLRPRRRPHRARLRRQDGRKLWSLQRARRAADAAQAGVVPPFEDTLVVGQGAAAGRLRPAARRRCAGRRRSASPRGTNEVERLVDLIGPVGRVGDLRLRARVPGGGRLRRRASAAALAWTKTVGGTDGVGGDDAHASSAPTRRDRITAWRTPTASAPGRSEALLHRGLGAPLRSAHRWSSATPRATLHLLSRDKRRAAGAPADRRRADRRRRRCVVGGTTASSSPATAACSRSAA